MSVDVSRIGYGASALGNLSREIAEDEAQAVLDAAYAHGIRYFDTSPLYGYGLSELRVGAFARRVGVGSIFLSTKVGRTFRPAYGDVVDRSIWHAPLPAIATLDYSYDGTLRSLEQSFLRTGISRFDRVFIHDIDMSTHGEHFDQRLEEVVDGAYRALMDLKGQGVVGEVGIGVNDSDAVERVLDRVDLDCIMLAGEYTLFRQPASRSLFPRLAGLSEPPKLILCGIFNSGALADPGNRRIDYASANAAATQKLEKLEKTAARHGVPLRDAALQFALKPAIVDCVVVGASRPGQIAGTLDALSTRIPEEFWEDVLATTG